MLRIPLWLGACCLTLPGALVGQLSLGLSVGTASFSGAARGAPSAGEVRFLPYRPTSVGVLVGWGREEVRLEGSARYGEPGLALRGVPLGDTEASSPGGMLIVSENAFRLASFTGGASLRALRLRGGPVVRAGTALVLERWSSPGSAARTVAGVQGGLAIEVALTRGLSARADAELGFTPASPFRASDLPEGFTPRS
ncbi:MAG TPA: hypothetical protein VLB00_09915, partial [Gemmatimonadales bacterium]|nr:hypothetical protein [Gemmatimonadales bacterium]